MKDILIGGAVLTLLALLVIFAPTWAKTFTHGLAAS